MFKEGDDVAFKNNIGLKMTVEEIVFKTISVPVSEKEDGSGFEKKEKRIIDGIVCFWMKGAEVCNHKFRTDVLVPWEIAMKGIDAVATYLESIKKKEQ